MYPGSRSIALDASGDLILCGGDNGVAGVFSISQKKVVQTLKTGNAAITDAIWAGNSAVISTSTGTIKIFDNGTETANFSSHAGEVTALAIHPSGAILAAVGIDKSFVFYDLEASTIATQVFTTSGKR